MLNLEFFNEYSGEYAAITLCFLPCTNFFLLMRPLKSSEAISFLIAVILLSNITGYDLDYNAKAKYKNTIRKAAIPPNTIVALTTTFKVCAINT